MQPQQPFGAPRQPLRPTTTQNPFLAQRPVAPAPSMSAMPAMQTAAPRPMNAGPMVGNPTVGNPMMNSPMMNNPMARPMAAAPVAPAAPTMPNSNPFAGLDSVEPDVKANAVSKEPNFGGDESMVADSSKGAKDNSKMMLYIAIGCGALGLIGIVFGVLGMMKKPETKVESKVEAVVSEEAANNIAEPYLVYLTPFNTVMDSGVSDMSKLMVAYRNLSYRGIDVYQSSALGTNVLFFNELNDTYYRLFGENLQKADYTAEGFPIFSYIVNEGGAEFFVVSGDAFGGAPDLADVTKLKSVALSDDGLTLTYYHDYVPICEYAENPSEGYCISSAIAFATNGASTFIDDHEDLVPTVDLTFAVGSDGKYMLTNVVKGDVPEAETEGDATEEGDLVEDGGTGTEGGDETLPESETIDDGAGEITE